MSYKGHPDQRFGATTYGQHGDDLMLLNLIELLDLHKPSYLDLGAHHPTTLSNTKLLYARGSRGVNIEANPNLIDEFNTERPEDTNVNIGVGLTRGVVPFFMYSPTSGRNTFSVEEMGRMQTAGMVVQNRISLPIFTIDDIVESYCGGKYPPILNCDIEGLDYDVLSTAEFVGSNSPIIICVETRRHETGQMRKMLSEKGYWCYCRMGENLFFIRTDKMAEVY